LSSSPSLDAPPTRTAPAPRPTAKERARRLKAAPGIALETLGRLSAQHPGARTELEHQSPFELLVSVVLSAQTTDVGVNKATPRLFARYPDANALAAAEPKDVEPYVATLGFFRMKAKSIVGLARALVRDHGGEVPRSMQELVKLPGVGRKTANVILGVLWNTPEGVVVDTHVMRLSQRLGWSRHTDPEKIERDLCRILPRSEWDHTGHVLIFHGRRICYARKPECEACRVNDVCPAAFAAEDVGRKPPRNRVPASARATKATNATKAKSATKAKTASKPKRASKAKRATKAGRGPRAGKTPKR
jgi:endonuclease III